MELFGELWWVAMLILALAAWIKFAEHPTARNLRRAIGDTLSL